MEVEASVAQEVAHEEVDAEAAEESLRSAEPLFERVKALLLDERVGYHTRRPRCQRLDYGWLWPPQQVMLRCLLRRSPRVIVELGSFLGRSTSFLLSHGGGALVFAIDHWDNDILLNDPRYK